MKYKLLYIFAILVIGLAYSEYCVPDMNSVNIDVTIREHPPGSTGYRTISTHTLGYEDSLEVFNYTKIYFYGYAPQSGICNSVCRAFQQDKFSAYLMVVTVPDGAYSYQKIENVSEGFTSGIYWSEGKSISFELTNFEAYGTCEEIEDVDESDYCWDFTKVGQCSKIPSYKCKQDTWSTGYRNYLTEVGSCAKTIWGATKNCIEGYSKNLCITWDIYTATCISDEWEYQIEENCSTSNLFCKVVDAGPSCVIYELSGYNGCSDRTVANTCSTDRPKFCTDNLDLIDSPRICGCPQYMIYDINTDSCRYLKCPDGTEFNSCSSNKPYFCYSGGNLVEKASICGCPAGLDINGENCLESRPPETEVPVINETPVTPPEPPTPSPNETVTNTLPVVTQTTDQTQPEVQERDETPRQEAETQATQTVEIPMNYIYIGIIVVLAAAVVYMFMTKKGK